MNGKNTRGGPLQKSKEKLCFTCKSQPHRGDAIYCSDACISKHAAKVKHCLANKKLKVVDTRMTNRILM